MPRTTPFIAGLCAALTPMLAAAPVVAQASAQTTAQTPAQTPFHFSTFNQAALARGAPLPGPLQAAQSGIALDWTSEFLIEQAADESLLLDGETLRVGLRAGLHPHWQGASWTLWGELPVLVAGGGVLDAGIEQWHEWFGLPNGNREFAADNQYHYRYVRDGQTIFDLTSGDTTLGDLRLGAARCSATGCWNTLLQLPTADADALLGGGLGLSAWYEHGYTLGARFSGVLGGGGYVQRTDGPLADRMLPANAFGWASLGYALTPRLQAGAQLYLHGPLYEDSALGALSRAGGQLSFGLRLRLANGSTLSLGAQEDVITQSSPDFVIHLAWRSVD